jgi:thiol-disulfide isomerase/thioredoxin
MPLESESAEIVYAKVLEKLSSVKAISCRYEIRGECNPEEGSLSVLRPDKVKKDDGELLEVMNGPFLYRYRKGDSTYFHFASEEVDERLTYAPPPADVFSGVLNLHPYDLKPKGNAVETYFGGYEVFRLTMASKDYESYLYVDKATLLPVGRMSGNIVIICYDIKVDAQLTSDDFVFVAPKGVKERRPASEAASTLTRGTLAPRVEGVYLDGKPFDFAEETSGAKAVLICFWYVNCGGCRAELPWLQKKSKELEGQGLKIITINPIDSSGAIEKYFKAEGLSLPVVMPPNGRKWASSVYKVGLYPTSYLLNSKGEVIESSVGFEEPTVVNKLRAAGFKIDL